MWLLIRKSLLWCSRTQFSVLLSRVHLSGLPESWREMPVFKVCIKCMKEEREGEEPA